MAWLLDRILTPNIATTLFASAVTLAACTGEEGSSPIVEETTGALDAGTFRWRCHSDADTTCGTGTFPFHIAVGSEFGLHFTPGSTLPGSVRFFELVTVSSARLSQDINGFHSQAQGHVAVLAEGDGYGVDYISFWALPVDTIIVDNDEDPPDVSCEAWACLDLPADAPMPRVFIPVGATERLNVIPRNGDNDLGGALIYEWEVPDSERLSIRGRGGNGATIQALTVGPAAIHVTAGGHTEVIYVAVYEPPAEPEPEPEPETTTGVDTDSVTGSGTDGMDTDESDSGESGSSGGSESGSDTAGEESSGGSTTGGAR